MPINIGYIENSCNNGEVRIRVYYDTTYPAGEGDSYLNAPLVNGPRGYCLDITNLTGRKADLVITNGETVIEMAVAKGDPVTTGPESGRSRTAAELAALGYQVRGDVSSFSLVC